MRPGPPRTAALVLVAAFALLGCRAVAPTCPNPADPACDEPGEEPTPEGLGETCRTDQECPHALVCSDGTCSPCERSGQCRPGLACDAGFCGACSEDAPCEDGRSCRRGWCVATELPVYDLGIAAGELEGFLEDIYSDRFLPCSLQVDGVDYPGCSVRLFGESTRGYPKRSFRIEFPEGAEHPGWSRKVSLRAEYADPSAMRSDLSYTTFAWLTEIPTPRSEHVLLRINGQDYGVMTSVERIGERFLRKHGRDPLASLYEAEHPPDPGGLMPLPEPEHYRVDATGRELYTKKAGDREDWSDLVALIEDELWEDFEDSPSIRESSVERTEEQVHLEPYLDYLAVNVLISNRDHVETNYHLSPQADLAGAVRWEFYPYDMDTTWGCTRRDGSNLCEGIDEDVWPWVGLAPTDEEIGPDHRVWMNLLHHLVLRNEPLADAWKRRICDALVGPFWTDGLPRLIEARAEVLRGPILADPRDRVDDEDDYDDAVDDLLWYLEARADNLQDDLCD